jgi:hypothetical protein|tara:strand:+ start:370 stop:591 length:222 start_codon:yes stop_codon:yes gene_type:complete
VITTRTPEADHGTTVSVFMSVSLDPPLIAISLDRRSKMLGKLRELGRYETLKNLFLEHDGLPALNRPGFIGDF